MNPAHQEALLQLTNERRLLSEIEKTINESGLASGLSRRAETTLALISLQLSFMWLGKAKGTLGSANPYPQSTNSSNNIIELPADVFEGEVPTYKTEVEFLKAMRALLKDVEPMIENDSQILLENRKYQDCIFNAWTNINNAILWLGQSLGQLKKEDPGKYPSSNDLKVNPPANKPPKAEKEQKPAKPESTLAKVIKKGKEVLGTKKQEKDGKQEQASNSNQNQGK